MDGPPRLTRKRPSSPDALSLFEEGFRLSSNEDGEGVLPEGFALTARSVLACQDVPHRRSGEDTRCETVTALHASRGFGEEHVEAGHAVLSARFR